MAVRDGPTYSPVGMTAGPQANGRPPRRPGWRRQLPWLLVGVLVITLGVVGTAILVSASNQRQPVLAAARDLPAGHAIAAEDLRIIQIATDAGVPLIPASHRATVIGSRLAVAVQAGAPFTTRQIGAPAWPAARQGVVGVAVEAGRYPSGIAPGDHVAVLLDPQQQTGGSVDPAASSPATGPSGSTSGAASGPQARERVDATVIAVTGTDTVPGAPAAGQDGGGGAARAGGAVVELQTSEDGAVLVASAPGVRLIAVAGDGG
ncbi:SAF domain-containing protein [Fodinicola feengrottensis]|uniref:SAF domain-containing protein n=1 Tax=Fodinicola feengrottensis TaxID=435914 RepID=A0ABN2FQZ9_9ACTN